MENIIYNELLARRYNVDVGIVETFDKNDEGKTTRTNYEVYIIFALRTNCVRNCNLANKL